MSPGSASVRDQIHSIYAMIWLPLAPDRKDRGLVARGSARVNATTSARRDLGRPKIRYTLLCPKPRSDAVLCVPRDNLMCSHGL